MRARISVGLVAGAMSSPSMNLGVGLQSASVGGYTCFLSTNAPLGSSANAGSQATLRLVATRTRSIMLEWAASANVLPVTYSIYAGKSPTSMPLVVDGLVGTSYELTNLDYLTPYYWQVVVVDSFGRLTPSSLYTFSIAPLQDHLIAAPNPFHPGNGNITFMFTMAGAGSADLQIYSMPDGRRVYSTTLQGLQDGVNTYAYDGRDSGGRYLPNGVFSVRLAKNGANGSSIERFKIVSAR